MFASYLVLAMLLRLGVRVSAMCENPFAGCSVSFNSSGLTEPAPRNKTVLVPSPSKDDVFDDGVDELIAGVTSYPWRCNDSGILWSRCVGPGIPICKVEVYYPSTPSPSPGNVDSKRKLLSESPVSSPSSSTSKFRTASDFEDSCRVRVAFAPVVEGWCRNEVCDTSCNTLTTKRRVFDFYIYIDEDPEDCPEGYMIFPEKIALIWFAAACALSPACCLGCFRFWQLSIRSRLYWRTYWIGCGAFQALIFKWPVGRVFFSAVGGATAVALLSFRKLDETSVRDNAYPAEEESLIGLDVFASWCFTASSYFWFVLVTSLPIAYTHKAMSAPLEPSKLDKNSNEETCDEVRSLEEADPATGKRLEDNEILKRLGMRSRYKHKKWIVQHIWRNYSKEELRKSEAILDVRSPMKPSDRLICAVTFQKSTWATQSLVYLLTLGIATVPSISAMLFGYPTTLLMHYGVTMQHGGYGVMLILWYLHIKASAPKAKRALGQNVLRPPGEPGKPTNGSKIALQRWRDRVEEARSRLNPVMERFHKIEVWASRVILVVAGLEILVAVFESYQRYLPLLEPIRWLASAPVLFTLLLFLPPFPRRTGISAYKTKTLVQLMQPYSRMFDNISEGNTNPQDGSLNGSLADGWARPATSSRYAVPVLLTADMSDTDTREAANMRLRKIHQILIRNSIRYDERDVRVLLHQFDQICGLDEIMGENDFLELCGLPPETRRLLSRFFSTLSEATALNSSSDRTGINFTAYVKGLNAICTANREDLAGIVFDIYDEDHGGDLDRSEIRMLLSEVNNSSDDTISEEQIDAFDADHSGTTDREEFREAARAYPSLLRPAYKLQKLLRENTLSVRRWIQIAEQAEKARNDLDLKVIDIS